MPISPRRRAATGDAPRLRAVPEPQHRSHRSYLQPERACPSSAGLVRPHPQRRDEGTQSVAVELDSTLDPIDPPGDDPRRGEKANGMSDNALRSSATAEPRRCQYAAGAIGSTKG